MKLGGWILLPIIIVFQALIINPTLLKEYIESKGSKLICWKNAMPCFQIMDRKVCDENESEKANTCISWTSDAECKNESLRAIINLYLQICKPECFSDADRCITEKVKRIEDTSIKSLFSKYFDHTIIMDESGRTNINKMKEVAALLNRRNDIKDVICCVIFYIEECVPEQPECNQIKKIMEVSAIGLRLRFNCPSMLYEETQLNCTAKVIRGSGPSVMANMFLIAFGFIGILSFGGLIQ